MKAILALSDGNYFEGEAFGASQSQGGEVCFNTSMTGYQEILTDPSYAGQMVCMTYPEIGNYGINTEDVESNRVQVSALIVKNLCPYPSSWRGTKKDSKTITLNEYLIQSGVPGIQGIDTRRLVRILRETGVKNGYLTSGTYTIEDVINKAKAQPSISETDFVKKVTCDSTSNWEESENSLRFRAGEDKDAAFTIAALDFGVKHNILRKLKSQGAKVLRFPATASAEEILAAEPDGIFLSNGPGDPEILDYAVNTVKKLMGKKPIFGICLGHQILGRALGGRTYKLKFGHRGANHPVKDLRSGKVEITSQNHGFALDAQSLNPQDVEITHINLNDNTVSGLRHRSLPIFSVQYHPEASPGPRDAHYLFEEFTESVLAAKKAGQHA